MIATRVIVAAWGICGIVAMVRAHGPAGLFALLLAPFLWFVTLSTFKNVKETTVRSQERGLSIDVAYARAYWFSAVTTAIMYGALGAVFCALAATRLTSDGVYPDMRFFAIMVCCDLVLVWAVFFVGFFRQRK